MAAAGESARRSLPARAVAFALAAAAAVAVGLVFVLTAPGRILELRTVDWRTRLARARGSADPEIVVVDIGEASLELLEPVVGRWPWPRDVHAAIIDALAAAGAKLVLYDILFAERDAARPAADAALVQSVRRAGNVLGAWQGTRQTTAEREPTGLVRVAAPPIDADVYAHALLPFPELAAAARALGAVNVAIDEDGVSRRGVVTVGYRGARYASLPLVAASIAAGVPAVVEAGRARIGGASVPLDRRGEALLRFRGPPPAFRHVSFADAFRAWGERVRGRASSFDWSVFRDRIVVVSTTAAGLFDQHSGPYPGEYPGGELLATTLDDLRRGDALREAGPWTARGAVALAAVAVAVPVFYADAAAGLGVAVVLVVLHPALVFAAFATDGLVLPLLGPLAAAITAGSAGAGYRYVTEGRQRRRIRAVFSRYASDAVVARLLESPEALDLGGTEVEITVLFSDIRDFTSHSERLPAPELVARLNEYFGAVTEAVFAEDGIINKFIGDAVMAVFGAPLAQPDHARRAVRTALGMLAALDSLNERWRAAGLEPWAIGVGIATGPAVVGNVGSIRRTEFTVIGDTVNLASRLEGQNKELGTKILVSGVTAAALGGEFALVPQGEIRVKGKERAVAVFAVPPERSSS